MLTVPLDGAWTVSALDGPVPPEVAGQTIPATVPGCVHLDLHAAQLIPEPFDGDNESSQQWIGDTTWRYRRTFTWTHDQAQAHDRHDLVVDGLDTVAAVELNGRVVATTKNQHRSFRWSVGHLLREGENELVVTFEAPVPVAERFAQENGGELFHVNHHPYNAIRKNASNYGWDWGIDVATVGVWRSIGIESWSTVRLASVRPLVDVVATTGLLSAHVELEHFGMPRPHDVTVTASRDGLTYSATGTVTTTGTIQVAVPDVALWWPRGYGEAAQYDVEVTVGTPGATDSATGAEDVRTWRHTVGFRTVELDTTPDAYGNRFVLWVNGRDVEIRGANWIPDDAFVTRIDADRLARRVNDAVEANMNLLRVWGGGLYEADALYEECSRQGVLVWQDFLLACAAYAEESWLAEEIEAEAREAITRLSTHASLVLWCGNNENLVGWSEWGWRPTLEGRTWGGGYYFDMFPALLAELDPTRPYIPGSPFSAGALLDPNKDTDGTVHIWDVWNEKDYTAYREWKPRFVAEFGFQGPPAWRTLFDAVHDSPADPFGTQMLVHQKANNGNLKLERGYTGHLPAPRTIDDWHFVTQLNQAHAIAFGISYFRSLAPYCTGTVVWQLNDDWPSISWAAVDYAERRKPLWFALRNVYAPRFATIQPTLVRGERELVDTEGLELALHNDTDDAFEGTARLRRLTFTGEVLAEDLLDVSVPARSRIRVPVPTDLAAPLDAGREILVANLDTFERVVYNFADVVDQHLDPHAVLASAETLATGARITVTASSYVRDVVVLADRADASAHVDAGLVSLLPGESATFTLTALGPIDATAATAPEVVRSANQLLGEPVGTPLPTNAAEATAQ